jgi:hypothetical protein
MYTTRLAEEEKNTLQIRLFLSNLANLRQLLQLLKKGNLSDKVLCQFSC